MSIFNFEQPFVFKIKVFLVNIQELKKDDTLENMNWSSIISIARKVSLRNLSIVLQTSVLVRLRSGEGIVHLNPKFQNASQIPSLPGAKITKIDVGQGGGESPLSPPAGGDSGNTDCQCGKSLTIIIYRCQI